ncbi:MG2 domain-containing protein [Porphyromonas somerae]|uniref:Alpha-2-macroglobulin family protein n=1 Tax=Porphyromonas somerae TaxID=322095 RepID=A0A134B7X0_9PORP|nr:MG2 domain-containing protein [Porphyromonas somerae]KXB74609.1 alpha-2-macroglobulin family protein [Porphyromonadaceae bacterium KA00676]KXB76022.1 alpha-2-macroglobulin family protein [Porphyromonas somerae]
MKIRYVLLVALSLSLPSYGQKKQSAKATPQIQRVQQIQRILKPNTSRQYDRNRTNIPLTRELIDYGMKKHDLNILLQGYSELWLRTVDRDPEAKINAYQTLHKLKSLPWLTATDRLALKLFTLCYYSDHQDRYRYRSEEIVAKHIDPVNPESWSQQDYNTFYTTRIRELISDPAALSASLKPYSAAFSIDEGTIGEPTFGTELLNNFPEDDALEALYREVLKTLRPVAEASKSVYYRALIDAQQILLDKDHMTEAQRIEALEGHLKKYATHPEVGVQLGSLLELYPYQRLRRARFLKSVIQRVMGLTPEMRKQLGEEAKRCRRPEILQRADRSYLDRVGVHLEAPYLVTKATVRLYKVPAIIRPDMREVWKPGSQDKPIATKEVTFQLDDLGEGKGAKPFSLDLPTPANYFLTTTFEYSPEASSKDLDATNSLMRTEYVYLGHEIGNAGAHQWLNARTGAPVADQSFHSYQISPDMVDFAYKGDVKTDALGFYHLKEGTYRYFMASGKDPLIAYSYHSSGWRKGEGPADPLRLYAYQGYVTTDRPAYRPGQTAHIYGVYSEVRMHAEDARVAASKALTLEVINASREKVQELKVQTDAFGRFSASITLPKEDLTGDYHIQARAASERDQELSSEFSCKFAVFEYKREGTELTVDMPQPPYQYGGTLPITGSVRTLSGSPVADARVRYTLERHATFWSFRGLSVDYSDRSKMEKITSEVVTDASGRFSFTVPLPEDPQKLTQREGDYFAPWYHYVLTVTSTDGAGESQKKFLNIPIGQPVGAVRVKLAQFIDRKSASTTLHFSNDTYRSRAEAPTVHYRLTSGGKVHLEGMTLTDSLIELAPRLASLPSGRYELDYTVKYRDSLSYVGQMALYLFDAHDSKVSDLRAPLLLSAGDGKYGAGKKPVVYYATSLPDAYIYYSVYSQRGPIASGVLRPKAGALCTLPIDISKEPTEPEEIDVQLYTVRDGRFLREEVKLQRTQPEKQLQITWDSFRDRLKAGDKETWSFTLRDDKGRPAEGVAVAVWMYDAALEAFGKLAPWDPTLRLKDTALSHLLGSYFISVDKQSGGRYPDGAWWTAWLGDKPRGAFRSPFIKKSATTEEDDDEEEDNVEPMLEIGSPMLYGARSTMQLSAEYKIVSAPSDMGSSRTRAKKAEESAPAVKLRKDFSETTFFLPELKTDSKGQVSWSFNAPEQLSRWRLVLNAHSRTLDHHIERRTVETSREFSIRPTLPRFVREGDAATLVTEVRNESPEAQYGTLTLELFDPASGAVRSTQQQTFDIAASSATTLSLPLEGYRGLDSVGVRVIARGNHSSDGEQHILPVLSDRETITETIAFSSHSEGTQRISLAPLFPSTGKIPESGLFTVTLQPNASRLALTALPVMTYNKEASAFAAATALFGQSVARLLVGYEPLHKWAEGVLNAPESTQKGTSYGALVGRDSLLSKSPWARRLKQEAEQERELARFLLSQDHTTTSDQLLKRLGDLQTSDGLWAWYPGMEGSLYTTEYVLRTLLRMAAYSDLESALRLRLEEMIRRGMKALDKQAVRDHAELVKAKRTGKSVYVYTDVDYLYLAALAKTRGLRDASEEAKKAESYFLRELRTNLRDMPLDDMPRAALIFLRAGEKKLAMELVESIRDYLVEDETGLFFARLQSGSYSWISRALPAAVETLELFSDPAIMDIERISGIKRWIVAQKRTNSWGRDLPTAEAVYGLTLGDPIAHELDKDAQARIDLPVVGGEAIRLEGDRLQVKIPFTSSVHPDTVLTLSQSQPAVLWGSATATYTLPTAEVEARGKQIQITRETFLLRRGSKGDELLPLAEGQELRVGDRIRTRLTIRLEQSLDFVQVIDPRPGFTEPIIQKPGYEWGEGAGYYVEPKDTETNFYIDHLNRGTYLLSYDQYVARAGRFAGTVARIVSCYAPDYSAHTAAGIVTSVLPLKK